MLSEIGPLHLAFIATVAAVIGAFVGKRLISRGRHPSRRHVAQAFAIPVFLTLVVVVVRVGRLTADPPRELEAYILVIAILSSVVIAFPYLVAIDFVFHRRVSLQFGLRGLLLAMSAVCVAAAVFSYVEWQTVVHILVIVAVWINWIVVAVLIVGTLDGRGPTRAGSIGSLVPTAAFGFTTLFTDPFTRNESQALRLLIIAYLTALFAYRVCLWRHRKLSD